MQIKKEGDIEGGKEGEKERDGDERVERGREELKTTQTVS